MAIPGFLKSKIQSPDILNTLWVWSFIGVAGFSPVLYDVFWPSHGGYDVRGYRLGRDFANVWLGARLTREGKLSHIYDFPAYMQEMRALFGQEYTQHNFSYPPDILPLIFVFGLLPYFPAFFAWIASGATALVAAIRANKDIVKSWRLPALMLLSPAFLVNIVTGQNGGFSAACFLGGFYLCESSPVIAGVLFGLLTVKPQLGVLIPFALLLRKNWKCIASAGVTTVCLVGLSLLLLGVAPWQDYWTKGISFQQSLLELSQGYYRLMMPGVYADARVVMQFSIGVSLIIQLACGALAFTLALLNVNRDGLSPRTIAMLAIATPLVVPYSFNYDLTIACGGAMIFLATVTEMPVLAHLLFGALWVLPSTIFEIKRMPYFPASSLTLMLLLVFLHVYGKTRAAPPA